MRVAPSTTFEIGLNFYLNCKASASHDQEFRTSLLTLKLYLEASEDRIDDLSLFFTLK